MRVMTGQEQAEEARLIADVSRWPHHVKLPLKRLTASGVQTGLLLAKAGKPDPVVYDANLWASTVNTESVLGRYPSIEAMVADGWVGD